VRALIVGCGRIAGGFNEGAATPVLSHAAAYRRLGVTIAACCDRAPDTAARFARRWTVAHHGSDLDALLAAARPEIVSICTPPEARREAFERCIGTASVRAVLLEKPLAASAADAAAIRAAALAWGRPALVDYFRAFDACYESLAEASRAGRYGALREGVARYYGDARANASHLLERALAMFGTPVESRPLFGSAASPAFLLQFPVGRLVFLPSDGCAYSPFELDLLFESARVRVCEAERRVEVFASVPHPLYPDYRMLERSPEPMPPPSPEGILASVAATVRAARGEAWSQDTLDRGAAVDELLERIEPRA
jgi:hypothetical protein